MARKLKDLVDLFEYSDYREYINAIIKELKATEDFSYRSFAKELGVRGHSYLHMILKGDRRLGPDGIVKVGLGLGLNKKEFTYFEVLVEFTQTKDLIKKDELYRKLLEAGRAGTAKDLELQKYDYLSNWLNVTLREIFASEHRHLSPSRLAEALGVERSDVRESIKLLEKLKLIEKDGKSYRAVDGALKIISQPGSALLRNYHREMLEQARHALDRLDVKKRYLSGLSIGLSKRDYEEVCQRIKDFRHELLARYGDTQEVEEIYHLNLQLFPLTQISKEEQK